MSEFNDEPDTDTEPEPEAPPERYGVPLVEGGDLPTLFPRRDQLIDVVRAAHDDGYVVCLDVTAVDYLTYGRRGGTDGEVLITPRVVPSLRGPNGEVDQRAERFEVVYHLHRHRPTSERLRLRVQVPAGEPVVPTLFELHPGTEAAEREVYDMFGIEFTGHPDLTRILMPEDWIGHPLRKDYYSGRIPVQFKDAPAAR
jgi:NADH-quinone oxidoreductase subunit C